MSRLRPEVSFPPRPDLEVLWRATPIPRHPEPPPPAESFSTFALGALGPQESHRSRHLQPRSPDCPGPSGRCPVSSDPRDCGAVAQFNMYPHRLALHWGPCPVGPRCWARSRDDVHLHRECGATRRGGVRRTPGPKVEPGWALKVPLESNGDPAVINAREGDSLSYKGRNTGSWRGAGRPDKPLVLLSPGSQGPAWLVCAVALGTKCRGGSTLPGFS